MDRQQIALKLAIHGLGLEFRINSFEDRLILQKAIYLAQAAGIHLGYYYHWYLYGPYCPALTRDAYAVDYERRQDVDESKGWSLDNESQLRLIQLQALIPEANQARRRKLELLASVHFLIDRRQVPGNDPREIAARLALFEKDFSEQEVQEALRELAENGLIGR